MKALIPLLLMAWSSVSAQSPRETTKRTIGANTVWLSTTIGRIALWIITVLVIANGLQACATKRPASQSKFDEPKHRIHKSRW